MRELVGANPQLIKIGDQLTIPAPVAIPQEGNGGSAPAPTRTYTVQPGETLYSIAIKFGTTVPALAAKNNIANPNLIQVGQVLVLP